MHSPGINGEAELKGQLANPGSPGKMAIKWSVCVCVCISILVAVSFYCDHLTIYIVSIFKFFPVLV